MSQQFKPIQIVAKQYPRGYPKKIETIGDHIRAARLERGLYQRDVAKLVGADSITIKNWELNHHQVTVRHMRQVIQFLGYCPYVPCPTLPEKARMYRITRGISVYAMADKLSVDPASVTRFEQDVRLRRPFKEALGRKVQAMIKWE